MTKKNGVSANELKAKTKFHIKWQTNLWPVYQLTTRTIKAPDVQSHKYNLVSFQRMLKIEISFKINSPTVCLFSVSVGRR